MTKSFDLAELFFAQATQRSGLVVSPAMDSFLEDEPFDYGFFWQCEDSEKHDDDGPNDHNTSSGAAAVSTEKASHLDLVLQH